MPDSLTNQPSDSDACASPDGPLLGGKYRLQRLLCEGGMGNVWLAHNELLELPVAIKVTRSDLRGTEAAARLLTEARVSAKLRHPHVVRVFDYGETPAADAYIVMELLEGSNLAEWLELRGALTPVLAVQLMLPVIDALCAAHRAGVIHRDLKPDNIFIADHGDRLCPKLLDFGIAKLGPEFQPRLTHPRGVLGSPAYMAPEQARGQDDLDQRIDVWGACVVLYECISGEPAYDADNYHALLRDVIERDLPPLEAASCEGLWEILRGGLQRDRAQRTASMQELGSALAGWLAARGESADTRLELAGWSWAVEPEPPRVARPERALGTARPERALETGRRRVPTPPQQDDAALRHPEVTPTLRMQHVTRRAALLRRLHAAMHSRAAVPLSVAACLVAGVLGLGLGHGSEDAEAEGDLAAAVELATRPAAVAAAAEAPAPQAAAPVVEEQPKAPAPRPEPAPVRLTSTRAPQTDPSEPHYTPQPSAAAEPAPSAPPKPPVAKPVLVVKRRAPATEAELGLKNPW